MRIGYCTTQKLTFTLSHIKLTITNLFTTICFQLVSLFVCFLHPPDAISRRVFTAPPQGPESVTRERTYLSFQAWVCWCRKYRRTGQPMLCPIRITRVALFIVYVCSTNVFMSFINSLISSEQTDDISIIHRKKRVLFKFHTTCLR